MSLPFRLRRVGQRFQAAWRLTSFELIVRAEHAIDRSAHLFQNKPWRNATHHFETGCAIGIGMPERNTYELFPFQFENTVPEFVGNQERRIDLSGKAWFPI